MITQKHFARRAGTFRRRSPAATPALGSIFASLRSASIVIAAIASSVVIACGGNAPPPPPPGGAPAAAAPKPSTSTAASQTPMPAPNFSEGDFSESDSSRDPFHNYAKLFAPTATATNAPQYTVVLDKFGVDDLKLVAIVNAGDGMRAMFVDPQGKGWVVTRGMHIGRGEMVRLGTGVQSAYPLYWKIDRIKPDSVVLMREDSLHPEVAPTYREIPLHVEGEKT